MFIETYTDQQFSAKADQNYQVVTSLNKQYKESQAVALAYVLGVRYTKEEGSQKHHMFSFSLISQKIKQNQLEINFSTESQL